MRKIISVALIITFCPLLLADSNPTLSSKASGEETTDLEALSATFKQAVQSVRPLSFEDLLARVQPQQAQPNLHQYPTPPVLYATQKTEGLIFASIGGGLIAMGVILAKSAGNFGGSRQKTRTVGGNWLECLLFTPCNPRRTETVTVSTENVGYIWGGIGLVTAGGVGLARSVQNGKVDGSGRCLKIICFCSTLSAKTGPVFASVLAGQIQRVFVPLLRIRPTVL